MKKSELYHKAQAAVLMSNVGMSSEEKLAVLHELMEKEELAEFVEKQEAEKEASENV
jgi:hypothetical protein